jgi:hypothetical protein
MINKKNLPLLLAFAIPVVMIVAIAISIYVPGIGKQPQHDFLYASGDTYNGNYSYMVINGFLQQVSRAVPLNAPGLPPGKVSEIPQTVNFYIYNVKTNSATQTPFDAAQKLHLNPSTQSSDGYIVERGNGSGGFPFGGPSDYNSWYIKGHNRARTLNIQANNSTPYYSDNIQFLGWIE